MKRPGGKHSGNNVAWVMVEGIPFVALELKRDDLTVSLVLTPREAIDLGSELQRVADEVLRRREDLRKANQ